MQHIVSVSSLYTVWAFGEEQTSMTNQRQRANIIALIGVRVIE